MKSVPWMLAVGLISLVLSSCFACSANREELPRQDISPKTHEIPTGPEKIVLVEKPIELQDEKEPFTSSVKFDFDLPSRPRRARLLLRYSGVPGALSEDYKMGRFRHRVELNKSFLMDLNTYSEREDQVVEYTKWVSPGMFRRHNQLVFLAGDDGNREGRPNCDEFELRSAVLEFDW